jgi:hypothetical protein
MMWEPIYCAFFAPSAWGERIMGWSCCLSAWFNSKTAGQIRMKFDMEGVPLETSRNRTFYFPSLGNNKTADKETCEVGSGVAPIAIGWDKNWGYEGYHGNQQQEVAVREVTMVSVFTLVTTNRMRQYIRLTVRCCTFVTEVGTISQDKIVVGVIRISATLTTVNNVTVCTVVTMEMRVCRDANYRVVYDI